MSKEKLNTEHYSHDQEVPVAEKSDVQADKEGEKKLSDIKSDAKTAASIEKKLKLYHQKQQAENVMATAESLSKSGAADAELISSLTDRLEKIKKQLKQQESEFLMGEQDDWEEVGPDEEESKKADWGGLDDQEILENEESLKEIRKKLVEKWKDEAIFDTLNFKFKYPEPLNAQKANQLAAAKLEREIDEADSIEQFIETGDNGGGRGLFGYAVDYYVGTFKEKTNGTDVALVKNVEVSFFPISRVESANKDSAVKTVPENNQLQD